jgi:hypothetical protein
MHCRCVHLHPHALRGTQVKSEVADRPGAQRVECAPLGARLVELGVARLDMLSIDVEGAELHVVGSLVAAVGRLSLGVLLVEVRGDGQRGEIVRALLRVGLRYVGTIRARGSEANEVVDDCFVNETHLRRFFPRSRATWALGHARTPRRTHGREDATSGSSST